MKRKKRIFLVRDRFGKASEKPQRIDTDPQTTDKKGLIGIYELLLRRFKNTMFLVTLTPLYMLGGAIMGVSLAPGIFIYKTVNVWTSSWPAIFHYTAIGGSIGVGIFLTGFMMIFIVPAINFLLRAYPRPYRGPYYSVDFVRWYIHNGLTYLLRYSFLEFITPTPYNVLFFQMMGMKVGRGTTINSSNISDPALIELGDYVTIGGSATLCGHYGQGGYLILAPVKIGDRVTIGLKASVMGGVEIGEGAKILPHSVVLPKTIIPPGETWGGVPAHKI